MRRITLIAAFFLLLSGLAKAEKGPAFLKGEALFNNNCANCHGVKGSGTDKGPPLVHSIYHPNHHADLSFKWAIERGVRSHHWKFGDMPKVDAVKSQEEIGLIISYIRSIQKEAGIF